MGGGEPVLLEGGQRTWAGDVERRVGGHPRLPPAQSPEQALLGPIDIALNFGPKKTKYFGYNTPWMNSAT